MTDDFTLDPARTYKPKQPVVAAQSAKTEQSPLDLAAIDVNNADELRNLAKQELLYVIKRNRGSLGVVTALRELLDRIDGKAPQASEITVKGTVRTESTLYGLTIDQQIAMVEYTAERLKRQRQRLIEEQGLMIESQ